MVCENVRQGDWEKKQAGGRERQCVEAESRAADACGGRTGAGEGVMCGGSVGAGQSGPADGCEGEVEQGKGRRDVGRMGERVAARQRRREAGGEVT